MMKKLLILGIVIVTLVAVYFTLYFIDVFGQILEVSGFNVFVESIEEQGYTEEYLIQRGISPEQARDIVNHPNRYRSVDFTFRPHNHSVWAAIADIQIKAHLPEEAKKRIVWIDYNNVPPVREAEDEQLYFIVTIFKLEEGDTEVDLMEICKQIRFTLTGKKVGFFDHGSISVPVHFSGD